MKNFNNYTKAQLIDIRTSLMGNITQDKPQLLDKVILINRILKERNKGKKEILTVNEQRLLYSMAESPNVTEIDVLEKIVKQDEAREHKSIVFTNPEYICAKKYLEKTKSSFSRNIAFDLTLNEFKSLLNKQRCYYSGIRLCDTGAKPNDVPPNYRTLDRIDNTKGYTKTNTVACAHKVNQLKNLLFETPHEEMRMTPKQVQLFLGKILKT